MAYDVWYFDITGGIEALFTAYLYIISVFCLFMSGHDLQYKEGYKQEILDKQREKMRDLRSE